MTCHYLWGVDTHYGRYANLLSIWILSTSKRERRIAMKIIGLIPARKGSKRVPGKNMVEVGGKSLVQRSIDSAKASGVFQKIVVTSDWDECLELAMKSGVEALRRPDKLCLDTSHDFEFVKHALSKLKGFDIFVILRPTSPFRTGETIQRAINSFLNTKCDSMRAVEKTKSHPLKSWVRSSDGVSMVPYMLPYMSGTPKRRGFDVPAFDLGTQQLGDVYIQNGCIHIAWVKTLEDFGNVSGNTIAPFSTEGLEGLDINSPLDLEFANWIIKEKGEGI